jgi:ABC-type Fe3+/spermidine/putrescine transport system ATPase subunit
VIAPMAPPGPVARESGRSETARIALEDVWFRHRGAPVLAGLSLAVAPGEVLVLLGPSGSGKTTVLRLVLGFLAPERGAVRIDGRLVAADGRIVEPPEARGLAVVFQDLALWPHLTVHGNLAFGLEARRVPRSEREDRIAAALARLGLADKGGQYPGELSGGERQRVAIARALVLEPRGVLLDEPLTNLDAILRRDLLALLADVLRAGGTTAVYVTHDVREAAALGDRIAVLRDGRLDGTGTLAELRARPPSAFVRAVLDELPPQ